jgi:hypothetical protein
MRATSAGDGPAPLPEMEEPRRWEGKDRGGIDIVADRDVGVEVGLAVFQTDIGLTRFLVASSLWWGSAFRARQGKLGECQYAVNLKMTPTVTCSPAAYRAHVAGSIDLMLQPSRLRPAPTHCCPHPHINR